jgi:bacillopeptidase F
MKLASLFFALSLIIPSASFAQGSAANTAPSNNPGAKIDPALVPFAKGQSNQKVASIFIVLQNLSENLPAPTRYHHEQVVTYLKKAAFATQTKYDAYLAKVPNLREHMRPHRFYISTMTYSAVVTPEGLKIAAYGPGVVKIYGNRKVHRDPSSAPVEMRMVRETTYPYDLIDTQMDKVHAAYPQVTGEGVVIGSLDTGVDGKHPAVQGKIKLFYNGDKKAIGEPIDTDTHGTHTVGTMIGTGPNGTHMGMAPKAQIIAGAVLSGYDVMLEGMDFMLDPDKNASTSDFPRAINNSWHAGGAPDLELFYRAVNAWEAAGILPVFSAGNAGPKDSSITKPKEHPAAFAVAATGEDGKATNFSSRGPAVFNGQKVEKPNLAAPGNNILSALPGGKYGSMSGTSMAAPHVTGASALIYQIDPKLTPVQMRAIFMKSTNPVDESGNAIGSRIWNKVYGVGKMNVLSAVKLAQGVSTRRMGNLETIFEQSFRSPQQLSIDSIMDFERDEKAEDLFTYPAGEEGKTWVPAGDLF